MPRIVHFEVHAAEPERVVAALDRINALAERSPGFVWRLQDETGNATSLRPMGEDTLVNMSVWQDAESLHAFVYRSDHVGVMRRRREWSLDEPCPAI